MNKDIRLDFPQIKNGYIYFDTSATSLKPNSVIEAVNKYNRDLSSNIHRGMYFQSVETTNLYEAAREKVANFINALPEEIIFTRGTTSGLNIISQSYGLNNLDETSEIITSEQEHHSQFLPWQNVSLKTKAKLRFIKLDEQGKITIEEFKKVLNDNTKIVAINYVSNVLGYLNPIKEIIRLAHSKGALVVLDCAQAIQHFEIDVKELDVDFIAFSGHKMLAPTGVGVLYGKSQYLNVLEPVEFGGDMNEDVEKDSSTWKGLPQKFEAGTMPIAGVIGLAKAIEYIENLGFEYIEEKTKELYNHLLKELMNLEDIEIYNPYSDTGIITFNIKNVPAHDAISYYAENNIALRSGQHCAKLIHDFLNIHSSLRASVYFYNSIEEVERFINITKEAITYFKKIGF